MLASFLVFTNTNSRGDTAMKALQRSLGTLFWDCDGAGLGDAFSSTHVVAALAVTTVAIFLAFYFLQTSYATMTFFVSIALCLVYGMIGTLTVDLLMLRIEETMLGAVAGTFVAFRRLSGANTGGARCRAEANGLRRWRSCFRPRLRGKRQSLLNRSFAKAGRRLPRV